MQYVSHPAVNAPVEQRKFDALINSFYEGEKPSKTADQMTAFIKAHPYLDETCWQELDDTISFLLRNRMIPSDSSSLNNLLGAYLENHPMDVPNTSYDIAAFCFFYPNVIRGGSYDLSMLIRSEACKVLLWLAAGDEPWEARDTYQDLKSRIFTNSEIYANFALLRLGTLLYRMKGDIPPQLYASLPKGIGSGWEAKCAAINNLWLICRQFEFCAGWVQVKLYDKARYKLRKNDPIFCNADAIRLCKALCYYGALPKQRAMQYFDFPEEEQKAVALGRIRAFSEVKAQNLR